MTDEQDIPRVTPEERREAFEVRDRITLDGVVFEAHPEKGAWYEAGRVDQPGALYAPMNDDGSPDEPAEIIYSWTEACPRCGSVHPV